LFRTPMKKGLNFRSKGGAALFAAAAGVVLAAVLIMRYLGAAPASNSATTDNRPHVEVARPQRATLAQRLQSNATLEAFEETDLFAKISGYVSAVHADIGDHVAAGQLLAIVEVPEMDKELIEAKAQLDAKQKALETARREVDHNKANLALQEVTLKRQEILFKGRAITDQTLDEIRSKAEIAKADLGVADANRAFAAAQVDVAAATVEKIQTLLAYSRIIAPFDGVVSRRLVNRGDLVQAPTASRTTPLFTVERIDTIRVFCDIPENDVSHLRIGDPAIVKPFGLDGRTFTGTVTRIAFRLNPETRNMRTEIDLPNPDERLYPGMYAEVALAMDRRPDVLTVPLSAVGTDANGSFVNIVADDHVARLPIKIGLTDNGRVEVMDGLAEDATVIVSAKGAPPPGTAVQPSEGRGNS
jgi:RND family efflux transporter MFP subunit